MDTSPALCLKQNTKDFITIAVTKIHSLITQTVITHNLEIKILRSFFKIHLVKAGHKTISKG